MPLIRAVNVTLALIKYFKIIKFVKYCRSWSRITQNILRLVKSLLITNLTGIFFSLNMSVK